jgi:ribose/xylose/arabinose/galactoside ABC-type transport system permease subunit
MAVGATLALGAGAVDFSIAGNAAMTGSIAAVVAGYTFPEMGIIVGLLAALLVGFVNAAVTIRFRVNAFIATLAMAGTLRGISFVVSDSVGVFVDSGPLVTLGQGKVGEIPYSVFFFAIVAVLGGWMLRATTLGRSMLAVGGDPAAARIAGIRTEPVQFIGYIASALAAGLAGLLLTGRAGVAVPQAATGTELLVFSAVLLGGTSLNDVCSLRHSYLHIFHFFPSDYGR